MLADSYKVPAAGVVHQLRLRDFADLHAAQLYRRARPADPAAESSKRSA